jgi:hypothetical protein
VLGPLEREKSISLNRCNNGALTNPRVEVEVELALLSKGCTIQYVGNPTGPQELNCKVNPPAERNDWHSRCFGNQDDDGFNDKNLISFSFY